MYIPKASHFSVLGRSYIWKQDVMQIHECITGHAKEVQACYSIMQHLLHPLCGCKLRYGARKMYQTTLLLQQVLHFFHQCKCGHPVHQLL